MTQLHPWLVPLARSTSGDLPRIGGKNYGLGLLARLGLRTPDGFALTTDAFEAHLKSCEIDGDALASPDDCRARILEAPLGTATRDALAEARALIDGGATGIAVRSSLYPFEDDPRHACAGLFVSRLNLRAEDEVEAALKACFASLFTESTLAYFERNQLDIGRARMSVSLQATVNAAASATVFTQDPLTMNPRLLYVDAAHGFGGVTNSALVETDGFFIEKDDTVRIVARRKGTKRRRLRLGKAGGLDLVPNTSMGFALDDDTLLRIAEDARKIEVFRRGPQDIELAVTPDGDIVYLQVRAQRPCFRGVVELSVDAAGAPPIARGTAVVFGAASAPIREHHDTSRNADAILVAEKLEVRDVPKLYGAKGLVVRYLPPTSHPAIHLREMGVPTLAVGDSLPDVIDRQGELATLDASSERGALYAGEFAVREDRLPVEALPRTAAGIHVLTPYPSPEWSAFLRDSSVEGIHIRGESINNDDVRTHPLALLAYDDDRVDGGDRYLIERRIAGYEDGASFYVAKFAERLTLMRATMRPDQCLTLRLTDLQTPDYRALIGGARFEGDEQNPALGFRGAARLLHPRFVRVLELELEALRVARERSGGRYQLLVPIVRAPEELERIRELMARHDLDIPLGMMVETPAAIFLARRFAALADFLVVGAGDLAQLVNSADRTHEDLRAFADPSGEATRAAIALFLRALHGSNKEVYLPDALYKSLAGSDLVGDLQLKVITWPDRLLRTARGMATAESRGRGSARPEPRATDELS
ncbi:MAG: hypothetical protein HOV80_36085 [Polyangiaceae bacterium]|nr:hypothetical protein [Polyangiaceae bacterium]